MRYEVYKEITITDDYSILDFISIGRHGNILKRIEFTPTDIPGFFNLAFGDIDDNGLINDQSISNNGDRNKIPATIAYVIDIYLNQYPDRWIYFKGSTQERTRLYRMAINTSLDELLLKFEIYAEQENGIIPFQNNIELLGLLVKKK